jgi:pilus assembly protein CpaF
MVSQGPAADLAADLAAGLLPGVRSRLAGAREAPLRLAELAPVVSQVARQTGQVLGNRDLEEVTARIADQLWRLGPLQPLLDLPGVTDVLVNGPAEVWVDQGHGLVRAPCALSGEDEVRALAVRLAASAGRRLDEACPWADARLPGGLRLHAVLPPISPSGTILSVRVLRQESFELADLARAGGLPPGWDQVLAGLVRSRVAFLISGGTGAGKTTLLAAMLSAVPAHERIVLVEDVGELRPRHPHVVRLEARRPNVEGQGTVGLDDLVRQALRMRPDRLVVGECRGPEVRDLLAALNTGHEGGCGTVHANTAADVPARLQALGALAGMSPGAITLQAAAALHAIIHVERDGPHRRVTEVAAVQGIREGELVLDTALRCDPRDPASPGTRGPGWSRLAARLREVPG